MMNQAEYDHYWAHGWTVVEGVYSVDEAEQIAQIALEISQQEMAEKRSNYEVDASSAGEMAPRKIMQPYRKDPAFQAFVMDPRLGQLLTDLLSAPPLLATDQLFMKPPHFGSAKPYHQDNFYFQCHPADSVITAWIALDDVDEKNGCLRYINGSHQGPILPHDPVPGEPHNLVPPAELVDLQKESLALVGKGGVVFHHCQTLHTSHRNESDRWRRGYATHWVTSDVISDNSTLDKAYYKAQTILHKHPSEKSKQRKRRLNRQSFAAQIYDGLSSLSKRRRTACAPSTDF